MSPDLPCQEIHMVFSDSPKIYLIYSDLQILIQFVRLGRSINREESEILHVPVASRRTGERVKGNTGVGGAEARSRINVGQGARCHPFSNK